MEQRRSEHASMTHTRFLALHGFGGTFGGKLETDPIASLIEGLQEQGVHAAVVAPRAPNPTVDGNLVAWLAGDQRPLGKVVGFNIKDSIVQAEGDKTTTPKPLSETDLPSLTSADDIWTGSIGVEASLAYLEDEWINGNFDGILGFSQGAMTAAMFCAHLNCNRPDLRQPLYVILCAGFMRPWPASVASWWPPKTALPTPSLHVIGRMDTVVANCRSVELQNLFLHPERCFHDLVGHPRHDGGHVLPWAGPDGHIDFFKDFASLVSRTLSSSNVGEPIPKKVRTSFQVFPLPLFGAEVVGLDIVAGVSYEDLVKLFHLSLEHDGLLVLKQQTSLKFHPAAYQDFAERFIRVANHEDPKETREVPIAFAEGKRMFGATNVWVPGFPNIRRIGNLQEHGGPAHVLNRIGRQWHLDGNKGDDPLFSFILGVEPGPSGSETLYASGYRIYDSLSPDMKKVADETICVMSNKYRCGGAAADDFERGLRMKDNGLRVLQGVEVSQRLPSWKLDERQNKPVSVHPETKRKALLIAPLGLDHVVGMEGDVEGSRQLVEDFLSLGVGDENIYTHSWQEGDLVLWDNRAILHSTTPYTYEHARRSLWQIVLRPSILS